ncbi:TonB-dependent receptor [Novosphingobium decolorationis]|uniref:TonB-dependent receptor n=1 Tax=Novosphingobium decolorationis TaxID=2698673 RepID=A0ABX8E6G1_9SPHN|nr:TonB-dependent receptor [Novosphingobium sp. MBES04]QVM84777.1 TonB-dependent receptor [Novosphingobium decolorationis]GAM04174.1 TonB-denpendent receptor [Novosphingobium sp. MBES04]
MMFKHTSRLLLSTVAFAPLVLGGTQAAHAQATAPAAQQGPAQSGLGDIVVTARKRKESALDVPIAISALSGEDIQSLNVQTVEDLTAVTPGMNLNNSITGSGRSDRSQTALIIRGMAPSRGNRTSSTFINGIQVSDGTVTGVFDFERVEVLKGPQSAYFGRQTFAGAINMVTAEPTDYFTGYVSGLAGTDDYYDLRGAVGGPIIQDVLSFRATGRYFTRDGSWKNNAEPGKTLGDQSTRSGTLQLKFTPSHNFTVNLFGMVANDDDGPGATGVILGSQSNCNLGAQDLPYFCGTLPGLLPGQPSARTEVNAGVANMLENYSPIMNQDEQIDHFGMTRDSNHFSGVAEYVTEGGTSITSLTGVNRNSWTVLYPLNAYASPYENTFTSGEFAQEYTDWPLMIQHEQKDFSQEVRIASNQDGRFRWMFGGSYLWAKGYEGYSEIYYFTGINSAFSSTSENKTWGGFLGLSYDLTDQLTVDFDARYQSDKVISRTGDTDDIVYQRTYNSFLPRVSLRYKPDLDTMVYATYSRGVNPGLGLDPLESADPAFVDDLIAMGVTRGVSPEYLDNFEVGFKGRFFNDRLIVSGDVYYDIWTDKITEQTLIIPNNSGGMPEISWFFTNMGKVTLKGIELDLTARPIDALTLTARGAINDTNIDEGLCSTCAQLTGSDDVSGQSLPFVSKYSAQVNAEFAQAFAPMPDYEWYLRSELSYKSGVYESEGNFAKTDASTKVNFRVGLRSDNVWIEGFVTNAFNDKTYTSVQPNWDLSNPNATFQEKDVMYVGLPQLRTWGARIRYDF